jgi:maltose alpha-D-glucosyltransferase / alpha-amylase
VRLDETSDQWWKNAVVYCLDGGFSSAPPDRLVRPLAGGGFGPDDVSVEAQRRDPESLLQWMERLIRRRRECPEFGWGTSTLLETAQPSIFAHTCEWEGSTVAAVHNLGEAPCATTLELGEDAKAVEDLLEPGEPEGLDGGRLDLELGRYGYRWLRVLR